MSEIEIKKLFFPFLILHTSRHILISVPLDAKRLDLSPTFCLMAIQKLHQPKNGVGGGSKNGYFNGTTGVTKGERGKNLEI